MNQPNRICAEEYTVKRGDSFYLIAHKLGVPLRDLLAANANIHPARLMVGDVLCIPREEDDTPQPVPPAENNSGSSNIPSGGTTTPEASQPEAGTAPAPSLACPETEQYTVEPGQTAADLQLRGLVSRHTLETANPGVNLDQLTPGQTVCVPAENIPCDLPETYTLGMGETLESVAVRFNLPVAGLLRANPCLAPQDFEESVTIVLPR